MHFERSRAKGVALVVVVAVVTVTGSGVGVAVSALAPGSAATQGMGSQVAPDDGSATEAVGEATPTAESESPDGESPEAESTETTTQTNATAGSAAENADGGATDSDVAETATATETGSPGTGEAANEAETATASEAGNATTPPANASGANASGTNTSVPNASAGDLSSCAVVDEPGRYDLTADVDGGSGTCIAIRSSDVVLDGGDHTVAGSGSGTGIRVAGGGTANVTVQNVDVSDWGVGVQVGGSDGGGHGSTLVDVAATGSTTGVRLVGADDAALQAVVARNNADGLVVDDAAGVRANDVTVADNDGTGLRLSGGASDGSFGFLQAVDNGGRGLSVGAGAEGNFVGDATITGNGGPGVTFADSSNNVLADSSVTDNGGPGVVSYQASGDRLTDVTVTGNGDGAYRDRGGSGGAVGAPVSLGDAASVQFGPGVAHVARTDSPSLPDGVRAAGSAVDVTLGDGDEPANARLTVPVDASGNVSVYQRVDGEWGELSSAAVVDGEARVRVAESGLVAPVVETSGNGSDAGGPAEAGGSADAPEADAPNDTDPAVDGQSADGQSVGGDATVDAQATDGGATGPTTLVVRPTSDDAAMEYSFRVDGNVTKVTSGNRSAEADDTVSRAGDLVTVNGTATDGDAYVVDGRLRSFRQVGGPAGFVVRYAGANRTGA